MIDEPSVLASADDADLLAGLRASDLDCLREVCRRHVDAVLAFARRSGLDERTAEDVAVEVFLTLWDDPAAAERPGLTLWDAVQDRAREVCSAAGGHGAPAVEEIPFDDAGAAAASVRDPRLDEEEQRALALAVRGTDYREIARAMGQPEDAVRRVLTSALLKLSD